MPRSGCMNCASHKQQTGREPGFKRRRRLLLKKPPTFSLLPERTLYPQCIIFLAPPRAILGAGVLLGCTSILWAERGNHGSRITLNRGPARADRELASAGDGSPPAGRSAPPRSGSWLLGTVNERVSLYSVLGRTDYQEITLYRQPAVC